MALEIRKAEIRRRNRAAGASARARSDRADAGGQSGTVRRGSNRDNLRDDCESVHTSAGTWPQRKFDTAIERWSRAQTRAAGKPGAAGYAQRSARRAEASKATTKSRQSPKASKSSRVKKRLRSESGIESAGGVSRGARSVQRRSGDQAARRRYCGGAAPGRLRRCSARFDEGAADYILAPIENSLAGSVHRSF